MATNCEIIVLEAATKVVSIIRLAKQGKRPDAQSIENYQIAKENVQRFLIFVVN